MYFYIHINRLTWETSATIRMDHGNGATANAYQSQHSGPFHPRHGSAR